MLFQQIRNAPTGAFSYLLGDRDSRQALVVDPVDQNLNVILALIGDLALDLRYILMTHGHAASAADALRLRAQAGGRIVASIACQILVADQRVDHGDCLPLGDEVIHVIGTPGHTQCSICYRWRDRVFTGDTLLFGACGDVNSADADAGCLFDSVTRRLFMLPPETLVFPGADANGRTVSTIAEEKAGNRLLSGRSREAFVTLMSSAPRQGASGSSLRSMS